MTLLFDCNQPLNMTICMNKVNMLFSTMCSEDYQNDNSDTNEINSQPHDKATS